jgi:hypothetical protein
VVAWFNRFTARDLAALALLVLLVLVNEPRPAVAAIIGPTDDRLLIFEDAGKLGWSSEEIEFAARAVGIIDCTDANGTTRRATFGSIGVTGTVTTTASILSGAERCEARRHLDQAPRVLPFPSGRFILGSTEAAPAAANDFAVLDLPKMPGAMTYPIDPTGLLATTSSVLYLVSAASSDWDHLDQPIVQLCRPMVRESALAAVTCDARNMMEGSVLLARNSDGILVAVGMLIGVASADVDELPPDIDQGVFSLVVLATGAFSQALEDIGASLPGSLQTASGLPFPGLQRPPTSAGAILLDNGIPVAFAGVTFEQPW